MRSSRFESVILKVSIYHGERCSPQTIMKDISDTGSQVTQYNKTLDLQHSGFASAVPACVKYVLYPSFLLLQLNPARCATVRCGRRRTKVLMP